jgi:hypothetical protein
LPRSTATWIERKIAAHETHAANHRHQLVDVPPRRQQEL